MGVVRSGVQISSVVLLRPFCCSDSRLCVGVSPLSDPRANKKGNCRRLSRQHRRPLCHPPPQTRTHTGTTCSSQTCRRIRHRAHLQREGENRGMELRNLSRLQQMSGQLQLTECHEFYLWRPQWPCPILTQHRVTA